MKPALNALEARNDKKRYEIELQYFKEWFKINYDKLRNKFEYFYSPYLSNPNMKAKLRKRFLKMIGTKANPSLSYSKRPTVMFDPIDDIHGMTTT